MKNFLSWLLLLLVLAVVGAGGWYIWQQETAPPGEAGPLTPAPVQPAAPPAAAEPEPERYPVEPPLPPAPAVDGEVAAGAPAPAPLPDLDASDEAVVAELQPLLGGTEVGSVIRSKDVLRRLVASVDNLSRDKLVEKIRLLNPVGGAFLVAGDEEAGTLRISEENYARYDRYVELLEGMDEEALIGVYRRYYPLLRQAYADLGYRDDYFNDRLVEVIDDLLATPATEGPIALRRPHVLYTFADPGLEALSAGQKMLLRMGPENAARVKVRLRQLRSELTALAPAVAD